MQLSELRQLRLQSQQISTHEHSTPEELVHWMGAMQAQDFAMAKWAVGLRLPAAKENDINQAFDSGKILRTHLLRPTWHLVAAEDIYWMLHLSAPQIMAITKGRHKQLELTPSILTKSKNVIIKVLEEKGSASRNTLKDALEKAKIPTIENRLSHILMDAEINGLICNNESSSHDPAYAILAERVSNKKTYSREEAIALLALRYFKSHGPATLKDFSWWSGLSLGEAKQGLENIKSKLLSISGKGNTFYLHNISIARQQNNSLFLLPAFDEYFIAYKDRDALIIKKHYSKAASNNGIFSFVSSRGPLSK